MGERNTAKCTVCGTKDKYVSYNRIYAEFDLIFLLLLLCFNELNSGPSMFCYYNP